jgi:hypothetical protein
MLQEIETQLFTLHQLQVRLLKISLLNAILKVMPFVYMLQEADAAVLILEWLSTITSVM